MRAVWILAAVGVAAVVAWLLLPVPAPEIPDLMEDDAATPEAAPVLKGRAPTSAPAAAPELGRGPFVLRGSVEDTEGRPLEGIEVQLESYVERSFLADAPGRWIEAESSGQPETYEHLATTESAADGRFAFRGLAAGGASGYRVRAVPAAPWTPTARHAYDLKNNKFVRLVLGKGDALRVRVTDAQGAGLRAFVSGWREREGASWFPCSFESVPTDADGRVVLYLPEGAFTCGVAAPGVGRSEGVLLDTPRSREFVITLGVRGGARVTGVITDTAGKPIAGARVLASVSARGDAGLDRVTTSAADGTYRIDDLPDGNLDLIAVMARGFLTAEQRATGRDLRSGATSSVNVTLLRGGVLEGRVRGPDGRGIAGAQVEARAEHTPDGFVGADRTVTDAEGRYMMRAVPLAAGRLRVGAPGFYRPNSDRSFYVIEGESDHKVVDVTLARGVPVAGRVIDTTGRPVAGAAVVAQGTSLQGWWPGHSAGRSALTDAAGRFVFPGLPPAKEWRLTARTEEALSIARGVDTSSGTAVPSRLDIVLRVGAVVEGRVVREGAAVTDLLRVQARASLHSGTQTVTVERDGAFILRGLPPGQYDLYAVNWNLDRVSSAESLTLDWDASRRDVVLEMLPLGRIAGVVVDAAGEPVTGLSVRLDISRPGVGRSVSANTDRRGRFAFDTVPDGDSTFPIYIENVRQPGTYRVGEVDIRLVHEAPERVRLEGTVLLPDGTPAARGSVMLWETSPDGGRSGRGVPIVDGAFGQTLERASEATTYSAEVREVFDVLGRLVSTQPRTIDRVEPGRPIQFRLVAGLALAGVVVDADGTPASGVVVSIAPKGERLHFRRKNMKTRQDGSFHFGSLGPGVFTLRIERPPAPWITPPTQAVSAGTEDVRITLQRGGTIQGRVLAPDGTPLAGARVSWDRPQTGPLTTLSSEDGTFELSPVASGVEGSVSASPPAGTQTPLVGVRVDGLRADATNVELRLKVGAYIDGEIVGPDGEAVRGAWVMCQEAAGAQRSFGHVRPAGGTSFRIGPVPHGRYVLRVGASGAYVSPDPVEVDAPGESVRITVPKGLTIKGTLVGAERLERFSMEFARMTPDGPSGMSGNVMASGQFLLTLRADDVGTLYFHAREGGDLYGLVESVRPSAETLTVPLQQGLTIEGRIEPYAEGDNGYVYIQAPSGITPHGKVAKDGSFVVHAVPPGVYDIHGISARQKLVSVKGVRAGTKEHVLRAP